MPKTLHRIYIWTMTLIVIFTTVYLSYIGYDYYSTALEERFYHPKHDWFKPSGAYGHGLGILGTVLMLVGVVIYIARKRYNFLHRQIRLKYLLEFHIFLCVLGPIMIVFHTAFKFGGIVSIAFWCMVAVVLSGVVGRFIYIQIPHTIEGKMMNVNDIQLDRLALYNSIKSFGDIDDLLIVRLQDFSKKITLQKTSLNPFSHWMLKWKQRTMIKSMLKNTAINLSAQNRIISTMQEEMDLGFKIHRLEQMKNLFKYWHVAHLPFALIMLIIVVVHVIATLAFGYKWIF